MNFHLPHIPEPTGPRAQAAVILGKLLLLLVIVALVVASVVQQRNQRELKKTQQQLSAVQIEANLAHNDNACAMRVLTHTLVSRTQVALHRSTTLKKDKPGLRVAIAAYSALHDRQVTVPHTFDCAILTP